MGRDDQPAKGGKGPPSHGVTKADLVDIVYRRHGALTRSEAAEVVDTIFKTMKATLLDGRPIRLQNFGAFEVASRAQRKGVNPVSGKTIEIPSRKGLTFRPAKRLKSAVQKPGGER